MKIMLCLSAIMKAIISVFSENSVAVDECHRIRLQKAEALPKSIVLAIPSSPWSKKIWYIPTLFHAILFSLNMFRKVVQRSSFVCCLDYIACLFVSFCWHYILLHQILLCLILFLPVIWLDVTSLCPACPLPAVVSFVISELSLVPSLLLGRKLCIQIHKISMLLSSLGKPGEKCEHFSAVVMLYLTFFWIILNCSYL